MIDTGMSRKETVYLLLIASFYGFGILFHALELTRPLMAGATPVVLFLLGVVIMVPPLRSASETAGSSVGHLLIWMALVYLVTFLLEAVGTATGVIFGPYRYGPVLGPMLFDVPIIIGYNWMLIVMGLSAAVFSTLDRLATGRKIPAELRGLGGALLVGAGCTLFDYVMEPVAVAFNYWRWSGGDIPLQNYLAWFCIATVAALAWRGAGLRLDHPWPRWYVLIQFSFFLGITLFVL